MTGCGEAILSRNRPESARCAASIDSGNWMCRQRGAGNQADLAQRKGTGERRLVRDSVHPLPPEWFTTSARSLPNVAPRSRTSSRLSVIIYLLCCSKDSQLLVFQHLYDHRPQTHNIHVFTRG